MPGKKTYNTKPPEFAFGIADTILEKVAEKYKGKKEYPAVLRKYIKSDKQ